MAGRKASPEGGFLHEAWQVAHRPVAAISGLLSGRRKWGENEPARPQRSAPSRPLPGAPSEAQTRLIDRIAEASERKALNGDDELSYDLGIVGDDLDDLLTWVAETFGVEFSDIGSGDLPLNEPPQHLHDWRGCPLFKSMTVGDLSDAVANKSWKYG